MRRLSKYIAILKGADLSTSSSTTYRLPPVRQGILLEDIDRGNTQWRKSSGQCLPGGRCVGCGKL